MGDFEFTIFLLASFFIAIILFVMAMLAFNLKTRTAKTFGIFLILISVWCFSVGGKMLSVTEGIAFVWATFITIAGSFAPPMFLVFALHFVNREKYFSFWNCFLIALDPIIAVVLFIIPACRHLYIVEFIYDDILGYLVTVGWKVGPYYWVHMTMSALFIILSDMIIFRYAKEWPKKSRRKAIYLVIATAIPLMTAVIRMLNLIPGIHGNIDVFGFALAAGIGGLVIYRDEFLRLQPVSGRQLMEELPDPLLVFNADQQIEEMNSSARRYFELPLKKEMQDIFKTYLQDAQLAKGQRIRKKMKLEQLGRTFHFEVYLSPIFYRTQITGYQVFLRDVSELMLSLEKLELLATTDPLTGLFNRRYYHFEGDRIYAQALRYHHPICVMSLDIDHFKMINDQYGHPTGDAALQWVAALIEETVRKADIVARFGGDEFFILLPETSDKVAVALANRIQNCLKNNPFQAEGIQEVINLSVGIASYYPSDESPDFSLDELIRKADLMLYEAKQDGRDLVRTISL